MSRHHFNVHPTVRIRLVSEDPAELQRWVDFLSSRTRVHSSDGGKRTADGRAVMWWVEAELPPQPPAPSAAPAKHPPDPPPWGEPPPQTAPQPRKHNTTQAGRTQRGQPRRTQPAGDGDLQAGLAALRDQYQPEWRRR